MSEPITADELDEIQKLEIRLNKMRVALLAIMDTPSRDDARAVSTRAYEADNAAILE